MGPPPTKKQRLVCSNCSALSLSNSCSGKYPCLQCLDQGVECSFPSRSRSQTSNATLELGREAHFSEALRWSHGTVASVRLVPDKESRSSRTRLEWQEGATQIQDLRIKQHSQYEPMIMFPGTSLADDEAEYIEREGAYTDGVKDFKLTHLASTMLQTTPIHPTILLNATLSERSITTSPTLHMGNCLSILNLNLEKQSQAIWRRNTSDGRPTSIGFGSFYHETDHSTPETSASRSDSLFPAFAPSSSTLLTTQYPILQIQASPLATPSSSLVACRTSTTLSLLHTNLSSSFSNSNPLLSSFSYTGQDLGCLPITDFALGGLAGGDKGGGLVVDRCGGLWGWGLGAVGTGRIGSGHWNKGKPEMFALRKKEKDGDYDGMVKVVYGGARGSDAVVGFRDEVLIYDLRSPKAKLKLVGSENVLVRPSSRPGHQLRSTITSLTTSSPQSPLLSYQEATTTPTPFHTICTTRDVIVLDERMPGKDLLSWEHGRVGPGGKGEDLSLSMLKVGAGRSSHNLDGSLQRLVLHSRHQSLLSFYTYSATSSDPPRSLLDPFSLPPPSTSWSRTGLAIVPSHKQRSSPHLNDHSTSTPESKEGWIIMESGSDGSLHSRYATLDDPDKSLLPVPSTARRKWDERTHELDRQSKWSTKACEPLALETKELDLRQVYKTIMRPVSPPFELDKKKKKQKQKKGEVEVEGEDEEMEMTENVEDRVASYLGSVKEALEIARETGEDCGSLTMYDLMSFRSKEDSSTSTIPSLPRPSSFLPSLLVKPLLAPPSLLDLESVLESGSHYLSNRFDWSASHLVNPSSDGAKYLGSKLAGDVPTSWESLHQKSRALAKQYGSSSTSTSLGNAGCRQVALDVNLGSRVYSLKSLISTTVPPEITNEPLPVDEDPPPLDLTYFSVNKDEGSDSDDEDLTTRRKRPSLKSLGARMVLGEWTIGSDPRSYDWKNPYVGEKVKVDEPFQFPSSPLPSTKLKTKKSELELPIGSSRPPLGSSRPPSFARFDTVVEESQASDSASNTMFPASQPAPQFGFGSSQPQSQSQALQFGASQVLPGAFGGRPVLGKKDKKAKKRVSGF